MNTNPLKKGLLTEIASGPGPVARRAIRQRAVELALIKGRTAGEATKAEWEQAKQELTGEAVVEFVRWDPLPVDDKVTDKAMRRRSAQKMTKAAGPDEPRLIK